MKSFKTFLLEQENYEDFLRAHFGSEPAKPMTHTLTSKITGGVHRDIPLHIGIDARTPGASRKNMFNGKHPIYKVPHAIHSVVPMTFDSEAIMNDKVHGKIHIIRYDASDAYNQIRELWRKNEKASSILKAPDFMNHPILANDTIMHNDEDISIGGFLKQFHGGEDKYRAYMSDRYSDKARNSDDPEFKKDIFAFYRKIRSDDGGGDGSSSDKPSPTLQLQPA